MPCEGSRSDQSARRAVIVAERRRNRWGARRECDVQVVRRSRNARGRPGDEGIESNTEVAAETATWGCGTATRAGTSCTRHASTRGVACAAANTRANSKTHLPGARASPRGTLFGVQMEIETTRFGRLTVDDERVMGAAARARVERDHSWDTRLTRLLTCSGFALDSFRASTSVAPALACAA